MTRTRLTLVAALAAAAMLASHFSRATADDTPRHKVVDGMNVYIGLMPSEAILGEEGVRASARADGRHYHVLVALFDEESGERVTDAAIEAYVAELGGIAPQFGTLETIHVDDVQTYGNFFAFPDPGAYRIRLTISRPGREKEETAEFVLDRPRE